MEFGVFHLFLEHPVSKLYVSCAIKIKADK